MPALLEQYRQSVLAAAFRGDLTADWRKTHPDAEPASVLLDRIRLDRRRRWEAAELARMKSPLRDDRWKARYPEPEPVDDSDLPELPEGWCWATAEEIVEPDAEIVYGIVQPGPQITDGVRTSAVPIFRTAVSWSTNFGVRARRLRNATSEPPYVAGTFFWVSSGRQKLRSYPTHLTEQTSHRVRPASDPRT